MKALTIYRPWTWAICHPGPRAKRVENRNWTPPPWLIGTDLAIHAGKQYDDEEADRFITSIIGERPSACPQGIVAVARVTGFRNRDGGTPHPDNPWFVGPVGWMIENVRVLPNPVPCRGAQGIWIVPTVVKIEVTMQLEAMR